MVSLRKREVKWEREWTETFALLCYYRRAASQRVSAQKEDVKRMKKRYCNLRASYIDDTEEERMCACVPPPMSLSSSSLDSSLWEKRRQEKGTTTTKKKKKKTRESIFGQEPVCLLLAIRWKCEATHTSQQPEELKANIEKEKEESALPPEFAPPFIRLSPRSKSAEKR